MCSSLRSENGAIEASEARSDIIIHRRSRRKIIQEVRDDKELSAQAQGASFLAVSRLHFVLDATLVR